MSTETDPRLTELLSKAGDEWGPLGVLRAVAEMWPDALNGLHDWNRRVWDAGYSVGQRHERETWEQRARDLAPTVRTTGSPA